MKKLALLVLLVFSQFSFSNEIEESVASNTEKTVCVEKYDPVMCCTRRAKTDGIPYGSVGYNQVIVTRCATSSESYQEAQAKACVLAEASAQRALEIAEETNESLKIGK